MRGLCGEGLRGHGRPVLPPWTEFQGCAATQGRGDEACRTDDGRLEPIIVDKIALARQHRHSAHGCAGVPRSHSIGHARGSREMLWRHQSDSLFATATAVAGDIGVRTTSVGEQPLRAGLGLPDPAVGHPVGLRPARGRPRGGMLVARPGRFSSGCPPIPRGARALEQGLGLYGWRQRRGRGAVAWQSSRPRPRGHNRGLREAGGWKPRRVQWLAGSSGQRQDKVSRQGRARCVPGCRAHPRQQHRRPLDGRRPWQPTVGGNSQLAG
mmetsp:Transcript_146597/g.470344  ORF Transcript_146597/g.470344 Transcript_146597/m.470344 type:complete len:267 (+) Transcript_146597:426-1226(+)